MRSSVAIDDLAVRRGASGRALVSGRRPDPASAAVARRRPGSCPPRRRSTPAISSSTTGRGERCYRSHCSGRWPVAAAALCSSRSCEPPLRCDPGPRSAADRERRARGRSRRVPVRAGGRPACPAALGTFGRYSSPAGAAERGRGSASEITRRQQRPWLCPVGSSCVGRWGEDTGCRVSAWHGMDFTIRQHAGAGLVAAAIVAAAFAAGAVRADRLRGGLDRDLGRGDRRPGRAGAARGTGRQRPPRSAGHLPRRDRGRSRSPRSAGRAIRAGPSRRRSASRSTSGSSPSRPARRARPARGEWIGGLTVGPRRSSRCSRCFAYLQPGLLGQRASARYPERRGPPLLSDRLLERRRPPCSRSRRSCSPTLRRGRPLARLRSRRPRRSRSPLLGIWLTSSRGGAVAVAVGLAVLVAASTDRSRLLLRIGDRRRRRRRS